MPSGGGAAGRWLGAVLVALVLLHAPAAWAAAAEGDEAAEPPGVAELEASFVARVADERRARGLAALAVADDLVAVARRHSQRMAAERRVFHNAGLPDEVAGWVALGENVGRGPTVEDLHGSFVASPTHRTEILRAGFTAVGVGVVRADDALWVTQVFRQSPVAPSPMPALTLPSAPRRAPAADHATSAAHTTTTTAVTTTTNVAPPPARHPPPALAAAPAAAPPPPVVPPAPAGVLAAGLLWAVVAAATGVTALAGRAPASPPA